MLNEIFTDINTNESERILETDCFALYFTRFYPVCNYIETLAECRSHILMSVETELISATGSINERLEWTVLASAKLSMGNCLMRTVDLNMD